MPAIPFPISSSPGQKGQEGAGRLVNCYAEKNEQGGRNPVLWKRVPGMAQLVDISSHNHLRGGIQVASTLISVMDNRVHTVSSAYASTNRGALAGTDKVTIGRNNASTPNVACVSEAGVFNLYVDAAPDAFADSDVGSPNSVSDFHGYLMFTAGGGRITASALNAVSIATNSFTTEQNSGTLLRGIAFEDEWFACGDKAIGVYYDAATSPFPLARRAQIENGIAGTHAIAASDALIWASKDGTVRMKRDYRAEVISSQDVARDVYAAIYAGRASELEAETYAFGNHSIWSLKLPGEWTWEFNITTLNWHERKSFGRDDWRSSTIVKAFDQYISGDRTGSKLFAINATEYREDLDPLVFDLTSGAVANFPARYGAPRADFDFTVGVGQAAGEDPIQTNPQALISVSRDGGATYGNPVPRALGAQGQSKNNVTVNRCGISTGKGYRFRLQVADPVHVVFGGGQLAAKQLAA